MRKSRQVRVLEDYYQRDIKEIVKAAYTRHQTIQAAAAALSRETGIEISRYTFGNWLLRLPITVRKVAS